MPGLCHAWVGKACLFVKKRTECSDAADPLHRLLWVHERKHVFGPRAVVLKNQN